MRNVLLTVLISTALWGPVACGAERAAATRGVIESIEFEGNKKYKDKTLAKKLDFEKGGHLDTILAESGRMSITEHYRSKGYANVDVTLDTEKLADGRVIYTIAEGERLRIKSVGFEGNKAIKSSDLRGTVKTKTRSWILWPTYYNEEKVARDLEKLQNLYFDRGYLNHYIEVKGQTHITFVIEEGPLYKVRNILLTGNEHFDNATLLAGLKLQSQQTYYRRQAQTHVRLISKLYGENGFVDARISQRPAFVSEPNVVDVEFKIIEGKQFRIGKIDIVGNERTQDKVIRRVLDEYDFAPGELYNAHMAPRQGGGQLERYVQTTTMAEQAIIKPVAPADGSDDRKDAVVDIKEGLTGMWNPGIAFGSDSGIIGQLILRQRNFDYTDWPESFGEFITMKAFKGAGQSLRVALEPGQYYSRYSVDFTERYLNDKPTSLNVGGSRWESFYKRSYDEQRIKGQVGLEKRYKSRWRGSLGFRVEGVDIHNLDGDAPQEIIDVRGNNSLVGLKFGIGKDMTDDIFLPSSGHTFNVNYEQVTGDEDFGILQGSRVQYWTLYEDLAERKTILAFKLLGATTLSDAPPFEKFYGGGTGTYGLRGFEYRGVSTRGLQTNVPFPVKKDTVGSDWIFLANGEIAVPLVKNVSALFFIDSGTIDTGKYRVSVGAGIQIQIPQYFGPVPMRFELATPLSRDGDDETQVFSFRMGSLF